jgi:hypothetical protein
MVKSNFDPNATVIGVTDPNATVFRPQPPQQAQMPAKHDVTQIVDSSEDVQDDGYKTSRRKGIVLTAAALGIAAVGGAAYYYHEHPSSNIGGGGSGSHSNTQPNPVAPPIYKDAPVAHSVDNDMTFTEAFKAARTEVGPGGVFEWHGKIYDTYYDEELSRMTPEQRHQYDLSVHLEPQPWQEHSEPIIAGPDIILEPEPQVIVVVVPTPTPNPIPAGPDEVGPQPDPTPFGPDIVNNDTAGLDGLPNEQPNTIIEAGQEGIVSNISNGDPSPFENNNEVAYSNQNNYNPEPEPEPGFNHNLDDNNNNESVAYNPTGLDTGMSGEPTPYSTADFDHHNSYGMDS